MNIFKSNKLRPFGGFQVWILLISTCYGCVFKSANPFFQSYKSVLSFGPLHSTSGSRKKQAVSEVLMGVESLRSCSSLCWLPVLSISPFGLYTEGPVFSLGNSLISAVFLIWVEPRFISRLLEKGVRVHVSRQRRLFWGRTYNNS